MSKKINRRNFFKTSAGCAAGLVSLPYFVRASALGKDGATAASNRLTVAQIGSGSMGQGDLNAFLSFKSEIQVVAICDVDENHAKQSKQRVDNAYGNSDCSTYGDYRDLLANEQVDIVSHALPDHWHGIIAVACASKGIDMYGQKPLARTIGEGRAICNAVKEHGVVWQTGSWQRSVGNFHRAVELVRNGRVGKVSYIEVGLPNGNKQGPAPNSKPKPKELDYNMWLGPAPWRPFQDFGRGSVHWDWRWIMDYSGGQLTDWAGHHIDIAHWGADMDHTGPVVIENGLAQYPSKGIYNTPYEYEFHCVYENGLRMKVANAARQPHGMGTCWYGDAGWVHVSRSGLWASDPKILQEQIGPDEIQIEKSNDHFRNFLDCVKSRKQTITPAETAHRSISVGLLGEIAMLTGRKLNWDPMAETFIGDPEANRYLMRSFRSPWHL